MFSIILFLIGIPLFGLGLYYVGWEIVNKDFSDFFVSGIIFMIVGGLLIWGAIRKYTNVKKQGNQPQAVKQSLGTCKNCGAELHADNSFQLNGNWYCNACQKPLLEKAYADLGRINQLLQEREQLEEKKKQLLLLKEATEKCISKATSENIKTSTSRNPKLIAEFLEHFYDDDKNGWLLKYQYSRYFNFEDDVLSVLTGNENKKITFKQESDNPTENNVIAIYLKEYKVGYIPEGHTHEREMTNDWLERNRVVFGIIDNINPINKTVDYRIGYFLPDDYGPYNEFPIIKTSQKDINDNKRSENLSECKVGDIVDIDYNYMFDTCTLSVGYGDEIGELGIAFFKWIENYPDKKMVGIISQLDYDEFDQLTAKIKIMLL